MTDCLGMAILSGDNCGLCQKSFSQKDTVISAYHGDVRLDERVNTAVRHTIHMHPSCCEKEVSYAIMHMKPDTYNEAILSCPLCALLLGDERSVNWKIGLVGPAIDDAILLCAFKNEGLTEEDFDEVCLQDWKAKHAMTDLFPLGGADERSAMWSEANSLARREAEACVRENSGFFSLVVNWSRLLCCRLLESWRRRDITRGQEIMNDLYFKYRQRKIDANLKLRRCKLYVDTLKRQKCSGEATPKVLT